MEIRKVACPKCRTAMEPRARHGVDIDLCPRCRGVWLDRGELDTIIERSSRFLEIKPPASVPRQRAQPGETCTADGFNWF
jgi:Zn-finger nucleic acid-binding protein